MRSPSDLFPYQQSASNFQCTHPNTAIFADMGLGKQQPVSEPVLTPSGWVKMGELKIGDRVIGSDGKPITVTGVFPQGVKPVVKVTFTDGGYCHVGWEHLWYTRNHNQYNRKQDGQVMTTREILNSGITRKNGKNAPINWWHIPMVQPVQYDAVDLPVEPYLLGVILGDGSIRPEGWVNICTDIEIIESVGLSVVRGHDTCDYVGYSSVPNMAQPMKLLGLNGKRSWEKFIPDLYMRGSPEQRLSLLQGLVDTDGSPITCGGGLEYSSTSESLVEGIVDLVRSLGGVAKKSESRITNFQNGEGRPSWRINIKLPLNMTPFRLKRKLDKWVRPTKYPPIRKIVSIEEVGVEESQCIMVDAPDHLYVTRDYVVTHNTIITLTSASYLLSIRYLKSVIIVAPIRVCRLVWRQEAVKWSHTKHLTFSMVMGTKDQRTRALMKPANIYLMNFENLQWLSETLHTYYISKGKELPFDGIVWDECFVAGTQVRTKNSHIAIDKLKIGDIVMTHLGPREVLNTMVKKSHDMVMITLNNGKVIHCTPNHPFKVGDEWIIAINLKSGDILYEEPQHTKIWSRYLSNMHSYILEKKRYTIYLFKRMCKQMAYATTSYQRFNNIWWDKSIRSSQERTRYMEQRERMARRNENKNEQFSQIEGKGLLTSIGREWVRRIMGRKSIEVGFTPTIQTRIYLPWDKEIRRISYTLQDRFRRRSEQDSNRSSRSISQYISRKTTRRKEAEITRRTRVDSVVHYKSTSGIDVWNIHVKEAETYYAEGVLVHNCSKMKNSSTKRVESFMKIYPHFKWTTGLTGTPASNGLKDLHGQFLVLDGGQRLGTSKTKFMTQWYKSEGRKDIPYRDTEDGIKKLISDITYELSAADYNPLPDMIVNDINVELPDDLRAMYDQMERDYFLTLDSGQDVEVFNAAALTNKLLQFSNGAMYPVAGMPLWEPIHDLKLEALEDIIEEAAGSPVLCAYQYRSDAERIMKKFHELDPINLTECKSEKALNDAMDRWKHDDCPLMIGYPGSMGHGLDGLQHHGHLLAWFGATWNLDYFVQFNARLRRQGQLAPVICNRILMLDTLDQAQVLALESKAETESSLRKAIKEYRLSKLK